jgi:hypothetical protein
VDECTTLVTGTKRALQGAVATARALVFEMGSTTPWLVAKYQDLRYVITDRVVSGAPVWAAEDGEQFMYRARNGQMLIGIEANCAAGEAVGWIYNNVRNPEVLAPTQLLSNKWMSCQSTTLGPQFTSAPARYPGGPEGAEGAWVNIPNMRINVWHGLDDAEPAMAAALQHLAALTGNV